MSAVLNEVSVVRGGRPILDKASLECDAGRFTVLCGPNGAGKSTALSVMTGALKPDRGTAELDGQPVGRTDSLELARRRAVVAQSSVLSFPFHVHEVVEMGRTPHVGRSSRKLDNDAVSAAMEAMEIAGLGARNYLTLSGGERQRVNIARALAQVWHEPGSGENRWLFLDEPTSALDLRHQIQLIALLKRLAGSGWGVVAVLHDLHLVHAHADEVVLFRDGGVMEAGEARSVLAPRTIQRAYRLAGPYALGA